MKKNHTMMQFLNGIWQQTAIIGSDWLRWPRN